MNDEPEVRFEVFHPDLDEVVDPAVCITQESAEFLVKEMDKVSPGHRWRLVVGKSQKHRTGKT